MLEATIEERCVKWITSRGGVGLKVKIESQRGFPDRLVLLPGIVCFVEFKKPRTGRRSPHQIAWVKVMKALGLNAFFCDNFKDFVKQITRIEGVK